MASSPTAYELGHAIRNAAWCTEPRSAPSAPCVQPFDDPPPTRRTLAVYTQDPATPRMDVAVADVVIPHEPLKPGPVGRLFEVVDFDESTGQSYRPLDLDALAPGFARGLRPTTTDPRFAQQMTYALAMRSYELFRVALGRDPQFFVSRPAEPNDSKDRGCVRLRIHPHAMQEENAYYDRDRGALLFGYTFAGGQASGLTQPGGIVFTALSFDIVVHEMTHALLDGLRPNLLLPTNPDVQAFHEGFADLVALFQRFQFRELVERGVARSGGQLTSQLLTDIAVQFGTSTGDGRAALRRAMLAAGSFDDPVPDAFLYSSDKQAHDLGAVLVAAVFDAFRWIFEQKTKKLKRLAEHDRRLHPSSALVELLAAEARRLAGQFLNIIIRAVDYCPPVDLTFGDYLRALVTADRDLVPEDPWGYREALVRAFRRYGIVVDNVPDLTEEALLWRAPERPLPPIPELAFEALRHRRDPGQQPEPEELLRRADAFGSFVTQPEYAFYFGLAPIRRSKSRPVERPIVESIGTLRRIGPDGELNFDLVAEIVQRRRTSAGRWLHGGSTVIVGADGAVRYAVCKQILRRRRRN